MKLQVLEYFITLAESRSINEAAQKLYLAQPSLTKALQHLEDELGVALFVRGKGGITLTEAGEKILPEARQMVAYYKGWLEMARRERPQAITIYSHISLSNFLLPDVLLEFKKREPDLVINHHAVFAPEKYLSSERTGPVLALFICREEEARKQAEAHGNLCRILFRGEYGCLVNRDNPLAGRDKVKLEELKEFYFIYPEVEAGAQPHTFSSPILEEMIRAASVHRAIQVESVGTVIRTIRKHADSCALSYYPALNRYEGVTSGELVYVPIDAPETKGDLCLFCAKQAYRQYPLLRELVREIQAAAGQFLSRAEG